MTPDRWARVKEVFHSALERAPLDRAAFVATATGSDAEVAREVARLLAAHERASDFMESPPVVVGTAEPLRRLGHYEIVSALGAGAMGEVFRAHDTTLNRDVALKVLDPSSAGDPGRLARFSREAQALAALNHPNIAAIYGVEDHAGTQALVLELVEGPTLADVIARGPMPLAEVLSIALQMADALEAAHERGIVHRDLKPANVKVRPDGTVKVLDFGLAKALRPMEPAASASPTHSGTQPGMILGTAAYMAPEQARGALVDRRADLWAFGAVLYEMLTGARAFGGTTVSDTLAAVLKATPDWTRLPPDSSSAIRRLLRRCLEKDQKQRLASAADARLEIQEALTAPPSLEHSHTPQRTWHPVWRLLPWGLTAALALAVVVEAWGPWRAQPQAPSLLRFQIPSPPHTSEAGMFTLSPDGRHLAFVAVTAGSSRLWLRDLEALEAHAIAGGEGATYPFWSPDSGFLGFFAQGKLKRISINGGTSRTLADAAAGRGGTWSRDGIIVFSPGPVSPLMRVSADGGAAVPVTTLASDDPSGGHRFPTFLPDGVHILYAASSDKADTTGVYWTTIDGRQGARLRPELTNALYAPAAGNAETPGYLVFRRGTSLVAQPFDPARLTVAGHVRPLAEGVPDDGNRGFGAFWASGSSLFYRIGTARANRALIWRSRTGDTLGSLGQPAAFGEGLRLSPDGSTAAVGIFSGDITYLWLENLRTDVLSRFTFHSGKEPVWSPDGRSVVFARQDVAPTVDIYRKTSTGDNQETLLFNAGINGMPLDWSPDGKWLIYQRQDAKTGFDLWLLPLEGSAPPVPYLQTPSNEMAAMFSPDGRWVAYQSDESGEMQVYVQAIPASGAKYQISREGGAQPQWRHDGKELFFISPDGQLVAVPVSLEGHFEPGNPQVLFSGVESNDYAAASDGQRFLMILAPTDDGSSGRSITVTVNWTAELTRRP